MPAGDALAKTRRSNAIDAVVVASAARRGDVIYTSDPGDLQEIARYFPAVRVLAA